MWLALALSGVLVAYNNLINRWEPFHSWAYLPANLAFATMVTAVARSADLTWRGLGVRGDTTDVLVALAPVAAFAVTAFAIARSRLGHRIADKRVEGLRGAALTYYVLIRIPVGTAVVEEVLFRGVLFAAWLAAGMTDIGAAFCASIAFGLWHISPTSIGVRMNDPRASIPKLAAAVIIVVLVTTIAGLGLTWMREATGGLLAPIVLHAGVNSMGALAAVVARRSQSTKPHSPPDSRM